jgi:hypothetical protein
MCGRVIGIDLGDLGDLCVYSDGQVVEVAMGFMGIVVLVFGLAMFLVWLVYRDDKAMKGGLEDWDASGGGMKGGVKVRTASGKVFTVGDKYYDPIGSIYGPDGEIVYGRDKHWQSVFRKESGTAVERDNEP